VEPYRPTHTGLTDLPLTQTGEGNARSLRERLKGLTFAKVFTSPLQRAVRTCELAGFKGAAEIDPDLVEWDYGDYEGLRGNEIRAERPCWQLFRDGCPGGESPEQVSARANRVIERVRAVAGNVLLFSSGHFIRVLAARWIGIEPTQNARSLMLSTASLSALGYENDLSRPVIRLWNDAHHVGAPIAFPVASKPTCLAETGNTNQQVAEAKMKATELLHELGQSLWLDNIRRDLVESGTLKRYIQEFSVTGLTSNPTIFEQAIKNSSAYDATIQENLAQNKSPEATFFELALQDLTRAADLFRPIFDRTNTVDGWVSLEVSPLLAYDTAHTLAAAKDLFGRAERPNLFIKIPGTTEGLPAIEEAIFSGIPVNVTLLFSREHYLAAADAFLRGIERRIDAGLNPNVGSVASVFISRWDTAVASKVPERLRNQLGIAIAKRIYKSARELLSSPRWQRVYNAGARPQRLLWASTGTKDPNASDVLYVEALAAPFTINTMPEATLKALAQHSQISSILPADGGNCEEQLAQFAKAGVDIDALAARLQDEGAKSFVKSWNELVAVIASKDVLLKKAS